MSPTETWRSEILSVLVMGLAFSVGCRAVAKGATGDQKIKDGGNRGSVSDAVVVDGGGGTPQVGLGDRHQPVRGGWYQTLRAEKPEW